MKLTSSNLQNLFGNKPLPQIILIYGPEEAEVSVSKQKILHHLQKSEPEELEIINHPFSTIRENPIVLRDEMASLSLLNNKRVIIISDTAASINKELIEVIKLSKGSTNVIFIAGDLAKTSSIRKFFEEEVTLLAIACYKPDQIRLKKTVREYLDKAGFKYQSEAVDTIVEILPANEHIIKNELDKLSLYLGDQKHLSYENIINVIGVNQEVSLDDLCKALTEKNINKIQKYLISLSNADVNYMLIVRVLANFLIKVIKVKTLMTEGKNIEQAIFSLKPPVFFKQKDNLVLAAKKLSLEEALIYFKKIVDIELKCKKGLAQPEVILNQELSLQISQNT